MQFFVRAARADDMPALDNLFARSYRQLLKADYPPSVLVTAVPLISRAQADLVTSGLFYVAEGPEGVILGAGGWSLRDPGSGQSRRRTGHIRHFATDPDATRLGVGQSVMARTLLDARDAGLSDMQCLSTRTAVPFYQAQGFAVQKAVDITLRPGITFPAIRMVRTLIPSEQPSSGGRSA